jgi:hypothetical protein
VRLLDGSGDERVSFHTGESLTIEVEYTSKMPIDAPIIGLVISTVDNVYVSGFTNDGQPGAIRLGEHGRFTCTIPRLPLLTGIYTLLVKIKDGNATVGWGRGISVFSVSAPGELRLSGDYGLVHIETTWANRDSVRQTVS